MVAIIVATVASYGPATALGASDTIAPMAINSASSPAIPFKVDRESTTELSGRVLGALFACAVVGLGGIYWLRRRQLPGISRAKSRRLEVLEVQRLNVKAAVVLLRWDQDELLLACNEGRTELVARKNKPASDDGQALENRGVTV
jgi:Flagellar biosynthesis protein, FliO